MPTRARKSHGERRRQGQMPSPSPVATGNSPIMFCFIAGLAVFFCYIALAPAQPPAGLKHIVAYVPEYRLKYVYENIDKVAKQVDEIILFSVQPGENGTVALQPGLGKKGLKYAQLFKKAGVSSVRLTIGGGGRSNGFHDVIQSPDRQARLVKQLLKICHDYNIDGVDLNWESLIDSEIPAYLLLLKQLKETLAPHKKTVSITIHLWQMLVAEAWALVDRVHIMAYDIPMPEGHSRFSDTTQQMMAFIANSGCPPSKLIFGVPGYGRRYSDVKTYSELVRDGMISTDSDVYDGYTFNSPATVARKVVWARTQGLGGVFLWEAGQDILGDDNLSLLRAMRLAAGPR